MAVHEFWLTDDSGKRIKLLDGYFFATYSKSVAGYGSFQMGIPYDLVRRDLNPLFVPDWRIECWRSPDREIPLRNERTYILREPRIYTRKEDNIQVVEYIGRDGLDLLSRRTVIQAAASTYATKTAAIDDMMKAIVREQMLYGSAVDETGVSDNSRAYPSGEFSVDADLTLGPTTTKTFQDRNVLDVLKELRDESFSLADINASSKIYFDVIPSQITGTARFGWTFRTYADLRGSDRTNGIEFSVENENFQSPDYSKSHLEEVNVVYVKNGTLVTKVTDQDRVNASRWNRLESVRFGYFDTAGTSLSSIGYAELGKGIPVEEITGDFLNVPENGRTPRSLYGVDWDFGDLLPVNYAGMQFDSEVKIVYISINEKGEESIIGRNRVN